MKDKTPCNKCGEWTISKRLGRAHYHCEECDYDKSLLDYYYWEATNKSSVPPKVTQNDAEDSLGVVNK